MNWVEELFKKRRDFDFEGDFIKVDDLFLAVLDKNKEINKIAIKDYHTKETRHIEQVRAFRELVVKAKEVLE